ncbi:CBS domain-containing protein [Athalassotoga saccharophila]|uniref:CBS domain-containing protein n=1 Tax=Athalassotoga saccharophila TaxID=1441386 RepID=UPI001379D7A0|nr:CBS domain-containing protein [Athalassotoga saccharophila]BBJ28908.1 CCA-adding enzyme [Athalassotoga saccharophila]
MRIKYFPATLDGLASAVAWKYLHPSSRIALAGEGSEEVKNFSQYEKLEKYPQKQITEEEKCYTSKLVRKIEKIKIKISSRDAQLFAFAIYSKTHALLSPHVSVDDILALAFCVKKGAILWGFSQFLEKGDLTAAEIMTSPVTSVKIDTSLSQVKEIIEKTSLTGLPVLDKEDRVVGMITKKDVDRALKAGIEDLSMAMSIPPVTVNLKDPASKVGELMAIHNIGRIPVLDEEGKIAGIITRRDLVRAMVDRTYYEKRLSIEGKIENIISPKLLSILKDIGDFASSKKQKIYAVGGFVRDLIMSKESLDVDIAIEGDGIEFAKEFANQKKVRCLTYPEFGTATIKFNGISIDIATTRTEYYEEPGTLPKVERSNLRRDLYRRDFTINAMAMDLTPQNFGVIIDFFGGLEDIKRKEIRVLHTLSFIEDPTRILRALRYVGRFDYKLSPNTEILLLKAIKGGYLSSVSPSRIRAELERSMEEERAAQIFSLYQNYGIFSALFCDSRIDFERFFSIARSENFSKTNKLYAMILLILKKCPLKRAIETMKMYGMPMKIVNSFSLLQDTKFLSSISNPKSKFSLYNTLKSLPLETLLALSYDEEERVFEYFEISKVKLEKINGAILKKMYGLEGMEIRKTLEKILEMKINDGTDEEEALKVVMNKK